ncbi:MAG: hypothetical protein P8Y99_01790 [Calditrichaceae bacterium]
MRYHNFLLVFIIVIYWCTNPFSTRDPEKPESGNNIYDNATIPKIVMDNLIKAIKEKNVNEYKKVFATETVGHSFTFEPEPSLIENFISNWTIQEEESYFNNLVNSANANFPILNLSFNVVEYSVPAVVPGSESDSVTTNSMQYVLTVNPGDSTTIYKGNTEFRLFRSKIDQFWYIYYWKDNAIDKDYNATWTNLKIKNYLGK